MRLTINLDQENYAIAKSLAKEAECSISKVVNQLVKKALQPNNASPRRTIIKDEDGLPVVKGKQVVTSDDVYRIENELLILNDGKTP